ncbi:MAG TPA: iron-containing alcohol dehydrogenase [Polyangia bacterium]|nr:iron-containing alcohol dehydrogenase [Polyangia bacterium]
MTGTSFEIAAPTRILFGAGTLAQVPDLARALGQRPLLVTGASPSRVRLGLESACPVVTIAGEPTVALVRAAAATARAAGCDLVIACGGGSALDAGKAIAALVGNDGDPLDYLEVVGRGRPIERAGLPFIAVPTTAGTGSEVTRNAVLSSPEHQVKASLRSPLMLARAAVIDPDLLIGVPPAVIASSGLDALSQLIEPFLSSRANPFTDALAREGIRRSARSLRRAYEEPHPAGGGGVVAAGAREDLALASLFGGLCLANAGLGAVHGFAAPIGGTWPAPHGATCAALLPHAMRVNLRALETRAPAHPARARFGELAALLTGRADAGAGEGIAWLDALVTALRIPGLARYGMTAGDIPALIEKARVASSMKANPLPLTDDELTEIAVRAL